jgi:enhancing lycopene biosynthesis protein 2
MSKTRPLVAVVLCGCGRHDGSEVHESVCTLLALDRAGAAYECVSPDRTGEAVDHGTGAGMGEVRNWRVESARIARGPVGDVAKADARRYDAVIVPGGNGAAKNLFDFAARGAACEAEPGAARFLRDAHAAGIPIGFVCIAPVLAARLFGAEAVRVTIGTDAATASAVEAMGARHVACGAEGVVVDERARIVTTPAYMLARGPAEVFAGISGLVEKVLEMTRVSV